MEELLVLVADKEKGEHRCFEEKHPEKRPEAAHLEEQHSTR
jgi:hypothetical protein